jgi:hypothetical protein
MQTTKMRQQMISTQFTFFNKQFQVKNNMPTTTNNNAISIPNQHGVTSLPMQDAINPNNIAVRADTTTRNEHIAANRETAFLKDATFDAARQENDTPIGTPRSMYDKVMLYFDEFAFNKQFDDYIKTVQQNTLLQQKITTNDLNEIANADIPPYADTLPHILINTKNAWKNIVLGKSNFDNNDVFYVAITFIIVALLYILLQYIFQ